MVQNLDLTIDLTTLSKAADVSPSQIRYWEQKGYINCQTEGKNTTHHYSYHSVIKTIIIKSFLDSGYTLAKAAEKASILDSTGNLIHKLTKQRFKAIESIDNYVAIDMGPLENHPNLHVYFIDKNGTLYARIINKS